MAETPKSDPKSALPRLPVPMDIVGRKDDVRPNRKAQTGGADIRAQEIGGGQKRGLKGGPETLERARSTYLASEYSGPYDRRPKTGRITKTDI